MKLAHSVVLVLLGCFSPSLTAFGTPISKHSAATVLEMSSTEGSHPFCSLPGDPGLILTTNVDLGDKKLEIMKGM